MLPNLLSNAVKFSPKGSTIRIEAKDRGDHVAIEVVDEGVGVPPRGSRTHLSAVLPGRHPAFG
ncbi:MAG: ATP-binding protein [Actinomycetota bacterium]